MRITKLFSYQDVFFDGVTKLHPGFRVEGVLYVLTRTRPLDSDYIVIEDESIIEGKFKRKKKRVFLTVAYNQAALRFNNISGGELVLPPLKILRPLRIKETKTQYFFHYPNFNANMQLKISNFVPIGKFLVFAKGTRLSPALLESIQAEMDTHKPDLAKAISCKIWGEPGPTQKILKTAEIAVDTVSGYAQESPENAAKVMDTTPNANSGLATLQSLFLLVDKYAQQEYAAAWIRLQEGLDAVVPGASALTTSTDEIIWESLSAFEAGTPEERAGMVEDIKALYEIHKEDIANANADAPDVTADAPADPISLEKLVTEGVGHKAPVPDPVIPDVEEPITEEAPVTDVPVNTEVAIPATTTVAVASTTFNNEMVVQVLEDNAAQLRSVKGILTSVAEFVDNSAQANMTLAAAIRASAVVEATTVETEEAVEAV